MKKFFFSILILFIFLLLFLSSPGAGKYESPAAIYAARSASAPQSVKKPEYDYMSSILSRNTKPLGLKDNLPLRRFLNQPSFKWAIRSGGRHILN
jgi:hypothetical protein